MMDKPVPNDQDKQDKKKKDEGKAADTSAQSNAEKQSEAAEDAQSASETGALISASEHPEASAASAGEPPGPQVIIEKTRSGIGWLAFLLAAIAIGCSVYLYYFLTQTLEQQRADYESRVSKAVSQSENAASAVVSSARQELSTVKGQMQQLQSQLKDDRQQVSELQDRLTRAVQQISKKTSNTRTDYLIAEVEYLLRLANQRVLMEKSAAGALGLLNSADKILSETDDVGVYPVRKALAKDIAALEAVPKIDREGIFLKLGALTDLVEKLRLVPLTEKHKLPNIIEELTPSGDGSSTMDNISNIWAGAMDKLSSLVVVQHRDEPVEPLLSPEQTYFLQQNLILLLEQAQMALLQGQQQPFDNSLEKATKWVKTYFEAKDGTTQALLKGLSEMKGTQVSPPLPDISGSLNELKRYVAEVHGDNKKA